MEKARLENQIPELLEEVNLAEQSYKLCAKLSQGMRKKLVIASAFLGQPQIVFLDEALNGIDLESIYNTKQMFRTLIQQMKNQDPLFDLERFVIEKFAQRKLEKLFNIVNQQ